MPLSKKKKGSPIRYLQLNRKRYVYVKQKIVFITIFSSIFVLQSFNNSIFVLIFKGDALSVKVIVVRNEIGDLSLAFAGRGCLRFIFALMPFGEVRINLPTQGIGK